MLLLPELRPTTVPTPLLLAQPPVGVPRGRGSPQRPGALPAPPSAPPSLLQQLLSPEAGMGSSPLRHAGSRAESLRLWPPSQAPSTVGGQSHRRGCSLPLPTRLLARCKAPEMLPPTSLEVLAFPSPPRCAREGGGREVPGVPENSACLQKGDVKIIKRR